MAKDFVMVFAICTHIKLYKNDLKNIQCPTLITHGSKDGIVIPDHAKHLHQNIKGSKMLEFADGKHGIHLQGVEEFNKIAQGSTRTDFTPQLDNFSTQDFTIYCYDPPGYGFSRPPDRTFPEKYLHRDSELVVKLMQMLNVEKVSFVGWSNGGISALITAAKYPTLVRSMVLIGANSHLTHQEVLLYQSIRDIGNWNEKKRATMVNLYGEQYLRQICAGCADAITSYNENLDFCTQDLKNIQCPTLIIHSKKDAVVAPQHAHHLHKNIKGSKILEFTDGIHEVHLQYPVEFNKIAQDFLNQN